VEKSLWRCRDVGEESKGLHRLRGDVESKPGAVFPKKAITSIRGRWGALSRQNAKLLILLLLLI